MKKTIKFFAAALAVIAAASCAKENPDSQLSERQEYTYELDDKTFNASFESPNSSTTKTTLANDGLTVYWEQGDQIAPFPYGGTGQYDKCPYDAYDNPWNKIYWQMTVTQNSGTSALFEGTIGNTSKYGAIYPYNSIKHSDCYGSVYTFKSLANQNVKPNDFPTTEWGVANISLALDHTADDVFKFKNCLSYIKFEIGETDDPIYSIEVSAEEVTTFVGATTVPNQTTSSNVGSELYYMTAHKKYCMNKNNDKPIIVTNGNNAFEVGKTYYIAIPAITMNGFSMICKDLNGTTILGKARQSQLDAEPNTIYNIGTLGESTEIGVDVPINPYAEAVHKTDSYGNIIGTDVKIYIQPTDASKIKDFSFSASIDNYRSLYTSNPNDVAIMTVLNDNRYLPRGDKGYYFITYEYSVNGNKKEPKYLRVDIPEPQFNITTEVASAHGYYLAGNINMANNTNPNYVKLNKVSIGIDDNVVDKNHINVKVEFNQDTFNQERNRNYLSLNKEYSLGIGNYTLTTTVTFDGISKTSTQQIYVTGLPYKDYKTTLYSNQETTVPNIYIPEDINVDINLDAMLVGYNGKSYITYTLYLGSEAFAETTQGYDASQTKAYVLNGKDVVLKANSSIKMESSVNDNYNDKYVQVKDFDILYR